MKTIRELNIDILNIIMKIHRNYPELSKYIKEMHVDTASMDTKNISAQNLTDYYNSLATLLEKYASTHTSIGIKKLTQQDYLQHLTFGILPAKEVKQHEIDPQFIIHPP